MINENSSIKGMLTISSTELEKLVLSIMILPIMLPFELNVGNDYIIYREARKLIKEPGHELLEYYFNSTYVDFMSMTEENEEVSERFSREIFNY